MLVTSAFILLLWPLPFFKANPLLFALAVYIGSIAAAWLIHKGLKAVRVKAMNRNG